MIRDKILEGISCVSKHVVDGMDEKERADFVSFIKHELVNKLTDALFPELDEGEKIVRLDPVTVEPDYTRYGYTYRQSLHVDYLTRCKKCMYYHGIDFAPEGWCVMFEKIMKKDDYCSHSKEEDRNENKD